MFANGLQINFPYLQITNNQIDKHYAFLIRSQVLYPVKLRVP